MKKHILLVFSIAVIVRTFMASCAKGDTCTCKDQYGNVYAEFDDSDNCADLCSQWVISHK